MDDVVIVGAGVAGLQLAHLLAEMGRSPRVLEAKARPGGRAWSRTFEGSAFDLGPAWVWPHQDQILALLEELGLEVFGQHSQGSLVFQDRARQVRRDLAFSTMGDALRIHGGVGALARAMAARHDVVQTSARVTKLMRTDHGVRIRLAHGETLDARRVVLALPPRLVAHSVLLEPALPPEVTQRMAAVPTWMAGHAKALAIYDAPFWRDMGLSGDGISHAGPLVELHDATPRDGALGALFGFLGVPPEWRRAHATSLEDMVLGQLVAMYGERAAAPRALWIADWAEDVDIATPADAQPLSEHPTYGPLPAFPEPWASCLWLGSTEVAPREGGYLEGALIIASTLAEALARP